jgi:hypothetical protein
MPNRVEGKNVEELLDQFVGPEVGSAAHEQITAAIQVRIAELQSEAARDSLAWAKLSALATAGATAIALIALLVAAL